MCLSKAYVEKGGKKEFLMTDIASVKVEDGKLTLKSLFGEKKEVAATIREIDFTASLLKLEFSGGGVPVD
ncbi:MAG: CooT family nickel-binding protein [Dehalococcoidales bacterium]|nr:CooT family nickel-binding protein [Dehalococcoidales bacterium]